MRITKRINPFGPAFGCWRGPGTNDLFQYSIDAMPNNWGNWFSSTEVRKLIEKNGQSFEHFKEFYKANAGKPKMTPSGYGPNPRWSCLYAATWVWDYAFTKGFGDYPYPRINSKNQIIESEAI